MKFGRPISILLALLGGAVGCVVFAVPAAADVPLLPPSVVNIIIALNPSTSTSASQPTFNHQRGPLSREGILSGGGPRGSFPGAPAPPFTTTPTPQVVQPAPAVAEPTAQARPAPNELPIVVPSGIGSSVPAGSAAATLRPVVAAAFAPSTPAQLISTVEEGWGLLWLVVALFVMVIIAVVFADGRQHRVDREPLLG